jgi:hypothetical protein
MTTPPPPPLDYSPHPPLQPRLALRTLTILTMLPATGYKTWVIVSAVSNLGTSVEPWLVLGSLMPLIVLISDFYLLWIFTAGWSRPRTKLWPLPMIISASCNTLAACCCGFAIGYVGGPLGMSDLQTFIALITVSLAIISAVLVIATCRLTDNEREKLQL